MSIRGYAALMTGLVGSIFGFDLIWTLTGMEAVGAMFEALLAGFVLAGAFLFVTEPRERQSRRPGRPVFVTDETGLAVMVQGRKHGKHWKD